MATSALVKRALIVFCLWLVACTSPAPDDALPRPTRSPQPDPTRERTIVVAVKGDWGAGTTAQHEVTQRMCAVRETAGFDVVVTTGDNFYDPDGTATRRNFYDPERCLLEGGITWRATWGNHDRAGRSTRTVLGAERWYAWSLGHVRFIALDSNSAADADQRRFLERELRAARDGLTVVAFHHPPFTVGHHEENETVKQNWVPLFERYGVSLVLAGHNHGYERHIFRGVRYVVTGGGGARLYPCVRDTRAVRTCRSEHHFLIVRIDGRNIEVRAIRPNGVTLDSFSFAA